MNNSTNQISVLFKQFETDAAQQLMQSLVGFTSSINQMNEDQLVAFYQALNLFAASQPKGNFFSKTKEEKMIAEIKNFVIGRMRTLVQAQWGGSARADLIHMFENATRKSFSYC